jgi:hypothetical protein
VQCFREFIRIAPANFASQLKQAEENIRKIEQILK